MDKTLANILGEAGLPEELIGSLQEAFDKKVAETREAAEVAVREEFAARYEHDKANLVEAMDRMLSDVVTKVEESKALEITKLKEARGKFDRAVNESKAFYRKKIKEALATSNTFIAEQLTKEIKGLRAEKVKVVEHKKKLDESASSMKSAVQGDYASRIKKIDEFVVRQVTRELAEFNEDRRALVEARVKVLSESKAKLKAVQARFVAESAKKVDKVVTETLKREMNQLHEDLERNRQNMFGRRVFEAVAAEYMTSYLSEGTEVRKLQSVLESKNAELASVTGKLNEAVAAIGSVHRKVKLAEDRAARTKIMSELLSSLSGDKKAVMESMLETTKTEGLRSAFDKLLPVVLAEGNRRPASEKKVLSETPAPARRVVSVTGDKANRLFESAQIETNNVDDAEIGAIMRLAGIQK